MHYYNRLLGLLMVVLLTGFMSCDQEIHTPMDLMAENIIPLPASVIASGSSFKLKPTTAIFTLDEDEEFINFALRMAACLESVVGRVYEVKSSGNLPKKNYINLSIDEKLGEKPESYELDITEDRIQIKGGSESGIYMGMQTLLQLLPVGEDSSQDYIEIATGKIVDAPLYSYRGSMLDVSRHFFGVEDVKRYIDLMSLYKMNVLHLHLADDQGWRIEIKSWPRLTEIGGKTEVGGGEGGFYTQEQYIDIVAYAQERFITIIPEIDMPGHTNAALASYAELNCDGKARELYTGTHVGFSTLCTDKEITYKFVDDVVREISDMTPGPYFHIGGDESHVTAKKDYIAFVTRVNKIVSSHGKQLVGWDEVVQAELSDNAVAQHWATVKNAEIAKEKGLQLILSPAKKAYLDMKYDSNTELGLAWAGLIEVDTGYLWTPSTYVPGVGNENILGVEAPLWSETVTNMDEIEFLAFPRLLGYAEIGWTQDSLRNWDNYKLRLAAHGPRMEAMGIGFYKSPLVPWVTDVETNPLVD